ncbi:MAG: histidine--tRNA ligase [Acidobacteriota bacterium]|nr:histidine--tRNA ligase [Acidobacteriota bacterium]
MSDPVTPFRAPTGTHDVLGPASAQWEGLVATFAELAFRYGFQMVITPLFEEVGVFNRGIGEDSDVAKKEMYVFSDRGDRVYALRPEGTAPVVRAFIQHAPTTPFKAWYVAPAFRYERPQAGRYRQHTQLGVEVLGTDDPAVDVEVIALAARFYERIGLTRVSLMVNSMGHAACRAEYLAILSDYLSAHAGELCDEHATRWAQNPLRVLDCKQPECVAVTDAGPQLSDHLCADCREHFAAVTRGLDALGIAWTRNPRLVRGFDYYTRTTFEFAAQALDAAQNAVGGGGRYDGLSEQLGGPAVGGIGFGSGVERLLLAREAEGVTHDLLRRTLDVFVVDTTGTDAATPLVDELRAAGLAVDRAYDGRSMKAQMRVADRSGARWAVIVGPQEVAAGEVTMRDLRGDESATSQRRVARADLVAALSEAT